jgi:hypothetical protein
LAKYDLTLGSVIQNQRGWLSSALMKVHSLYILDLIVTSEFIYTASSDLSMKQLRFDTWEVTRVFTGSLSFL